MGKLPWMEHGACIVGPQRWQSIFDGTQSILLGYLSFIIAMLGKIVS